MKYANDMYPVCNDAEHGGLLVVYSARHRGYIQTSISKTQRD